MKSIYIAGPISGHPYFAKKFNQAESDLIGKGWIVLNPARLPYGLTEPQYMDICLAMVRSADAVLMLPGWRDSVGASCERLLAIKGDKAIFNNLPTVPKVAA